MKLLFINAINTKKYIETVYPPLGLAYLSSYLKKHFQAIQIKIIDSKIEETLKEFRPNYVGVSSVSQNFNRAIFVADLCKKLNIPVFVGGVHITMLPESLPKIFDFGVVGEAEQTMVEVVDYLSKGGKSGSMEMKSINGLVLHDNEGILLTNKRPLLENLDLLPFPDRDLLNIHIGETTYLFSSRGCPYKCTFCASTRFWNKTRWFSSNYVLAELELIINKYKPKVITFYDDLAVANLSRFQEIVKGIKSKGIDKKVKFNFSCRANLVNENLIATLKQLDIERICFGLESGSQKTLDFLKPKMTIEKNRLALDMFHKAKIPIQATFIIGSPDESEKDILETYSFIKKSKLIDFETYILTPFPGTPVWDIALNKGIVSNGMNWEDLAVEVEDNPENKILLSNLPKNKIMELYNLIKREKIRRRHKYLILRIITNPLWIIKKIYERYKNYKHRNSVR
ncbi:MAG: B12-binding domain-containing radical SAM protein [Elusimicrobia bacterium]|nr:B12-binding domain-containing radical SAM protein [Elusimicrobiota bacterium]